MKSLLKLLPYLKPYTGLIIGSALLAIPLAALRFSPVPLVKFLIDDLLKSGDHGKLLMLPAIVIGIYLLNFIVRFFHYYLLRIVIGRVNQRIKNNLFQHLLGLSADYYTEQSTGTLISRVGSDPMQIDGGLATINILIREPLTFIALLAYTLHVNWRLTLITFLIFPFLAWVFAATGRLLKRYISRMQEENARLYSTLQETFTGIRVVKSFRLEKYVRKKFRERADAYTKFYLKTAVLEEAAHPMVELLTAFAVAAVVYYGGKLVLDGQMTTGELFAFFFAFGMMMNPIRMMNDINIRLNQAAAAADRIFEILEWKTRLHAPENPVRLKSFEREIEFHQMGFYYPDAPERKVLQNISFSIPKRRAVALVGASGSGKSSLVSLLPRIFDVTDGHITIDGHDIRTVDLDDLRSLIAVVSQDVFLFNDTIEENIRCGRLHATAEEVREAARRANAYDFIETLPAGFKTTIGDRGQKLSGGERQRISIARAFLRNAPILILDEATSNLDTASEKIVQQAIDDLMRDKTTLIIAHRLSTIRNADQIIVLKDGQIVETGRHDELLKSGGEYARFHLISQG